MRDIGLSETSASEFCSFLQSEHQTMEYWLDRYMENRIEKDVDNFLKNNNVFVENTHSHNKAFEEDPFNIEYVPDKFIKYVPHDYKTREMCDKAVEKDPENIRYIPDHFKTQEICDKAVMKDPWGFRFIPDKFITQEMCDKAVEEYPYLLKYVPDNFITQEGYGIL